VWSYSGVGPEYRGQWQHVGSCVWSYNGVGPEYRGQWDQMGKTG